VIVHDPAAAAGKLGFQEKTGISSVSRGSATVAHVKPA
jgi:hypothetical protein